MSDFDSPYIVFAAVLAVQWLAAYAGDALRRKIRPFKKEGEREDFDIVRTASLTLLGLIIGGLASRWPLAGTTSARIWKKRRQTQLAPSTYAPICCLPMMHRAYVK